MSELLSVDKAIESILSTASHVTETERVPLDDSSLRILAEDIIADINVPPADNSAMDGYALNTQDLTAETNTLTISQRITAGVPPMPLAAGTAARIFTGAEIPKGANAVIMQEQCQLQGEHVICPNAIPAGNNIRQCGQDILKGNTILKQGQCLGPQHIGLLASIGVAQVRVYRKLSVAVLSTGSELIEPGQVLAPGKIYNSNRFLLKSFLKCNDIHIIDLKSVADDLEATKAALQKATKADCILSTGGVSVGDEDYIKQAVMDLGELNLWRIAMKPGKPLAFGKIGNTPFFGLPGNPVSAFTTFCLFVQPFLQALQGQTITRAREYSFVADFDMKANPIRQEYIRIKRQGNSVSAFHNQSSGVLSSTTWADGLAIMPPNQNIVRGESINVLLFNDLIP